MNDGPDAGIIGGIIGGLGVLIAFFVLSKRANITKALNPRPKNIISFTVSMPADAVQKAIYDHAAKSKLKVEHIDAEQGLIVLAQDIGMTFHNGFWMFIYLSSPGPQTTLVEVGMKSKVYQVQWAINKVRDSQANKLYMSLTGLPKIPK